MAETEETKNREDRADKSESDETDSSLPHPPDGGWGWVVTLASFLVHFIADGLAFSFGVIYVELLDYFQESKGKTAWVGSLFIGIPLFAGPLAGALTNKYGCRVVTMAGSIITTVGFVLSAFANSIEVLCFSFGILSGVGLACVYVPAIVVVAFYFEKRRALATGIAVSGSGIGTFVFAPLTEYLINFYGWRGAVLILGGLVLNICVFGALYRPLESTSEKRRRKYLKSLQKFTRMSTKHRFSKNTTIEENQAIMATVSLQEISDTHLSPNGSHDSLSIQGCGSLYKLALKNATLARLESEVSQAMQGADSMPSLLQNGASKPSLAKKVTNQSRTSTLSKRDIFYRGSLMRLPTISRINSKSCPNLFTEVGNDQSDTTHSGCFCCSAEQKAAIKSVIDFSFFKKSVFVLFFFSNCLLYMWYDIPYMYMVDRALSFDIEQTKASFLISIFGIVSMIGQLLYGYFGDFEKVNTVLVYSVSIAACGGATMLLPLTGNYILMSLYCAAFAFFLSANYTLETIVIVELLGLDQLTNAYGLVMCGQGIANLLGPPLAGWLFDLTGTYDVSFYVAGTCIIVSGLMVFLIHITLHRSDTAKRNEDIENKDTSTGDEENKKNGIALSNDKDNSNVRNGHLRPHAASNGEVSHHEF